MAAIRFVGIRSSNSNSNSNRSSQQVARQVPLALPPSRVLQAVVELVVPPVQYQKYLVDDRLGRERPREYRQHRDRLRQGQLLVRIYRLPLWPGRGIRIPPPAETIKIQNLKP